MKQGIYSPIDDPILFQNRPFIALVTEGGDYKIIGRDYLRQRLPSEVKMGGIGKVSPYK